MRVIADDRCCAGTGEALHDRLTENARGSIVLSAHVRAKKYMIRHFPRLPYLGKYWRQRLGQMCIRDSFKYVKTF